MKNTAIIYSSLTGNTKKVAEAIFNVIPENKILLNSEEVKEDILKEYSDFIIGFWVDKGNANKEIIKIISKIKDKNISFFGTLGADPSSEHGQNVFSKVSALCQEKNNFLGGFLCLGKISDELVEKMKKFPLKLVHPLTPERIARIERASTHPDKDDLINAQNYFKNLYGDNYEK